MRRPLILPLAGVAALAAALAACSSGSSGASGSSAAAAGTSGTLAQRAKAAFPNGITFLDGSAAGGSSDIQARLVINDLKPILGVPVTIQYQTGGGGLQAASSVYKAAPDSGTLMLANSTQPGLDQDFLDPSLKAANYTPIGRIFGDDPVVLLARKGSQWTNIAALKKASDAGQTITVGATQDVSGTRLAVALLAASEHLKISMVPFSTGTTAADAAIGGSVDLAVTLIPQAQQLDSSGKTQGVLQFGDKANPSLPGVQAVGEIGLAEDEVVQDSGLVGPPDMPANQVSILEDALKQESTNADFLAQIKTQALVSSFEDADSWGKELNAVSATVSSKLMVIKPYMQ